MKITLLKITLLNFKGARFLEVPFSEYTNINGENGTYKTTLNDAFTWLLFGKDSKDRKDFNIKTLDPNNKPLHKLDHEVTGLLDVDGNQVELKRIYREKWVKKRGSSESEMVGHETTFFYNGVPLSLAEYTAKVDAIINEDLAKLLTNPLYFNGLKWQDRRNVLSEIAGKVSDDEVFDKITTIQNKADVSNLINVLNGGKSLEEYKRELAAKKKKIKDELDLIPARIDEVNRARPDECDLDGLQETIGACNKEIERLDNSMQDKAKASEEVYQTIQNLHNDINILNNKIRDAKQADSDKRWKMINDIDNKIRDLNTSISNANREIETCDKEIVSNASLIGKRTSEVEQIRKDWVELNEKEISINPNDISCPACKREFETGKVDEIKSKLIENFNTDKQRRLADFTTRGNEINSGIVSLQHRNDELMKRIETIKGNIEGFQLALDEQKQAKENAENQNFEPSPIIAELEGQIKQIEATIPEKPVIDTIELTERKKAIGVELDEAKKMLATQDQIEKINKRVAELEKEEKEMAQAIADFERWEFLINDFSKAKIDEIERRVNGKFQLVKFKMFETQINGGETECCECLVNGVPYSDVNTAGKINAGIDVLNVLMDHYNVAAPVWIDNRESINNILPCKSQIINLSVSTNKQLTIQ